MIECSKCGVKINENNYSLMAPLWTCDAHIHIIGCLKCYPDGVLDMSPFTSRGNTDWNKFFTIAIDGYPPPKHIFCDKILRLNDLPEEAINESFIDSCRQIFASNHQTPRPPRRYSFGRYLIGFALKHFI